MFTIELHGLSMEEGEAGVAEIWCCLEEYQIPSPDLTVVADATGYISLHCRFREPVGMQVVARRLSTWVTATNLRKARAPQHGAERPWRVIQNHHLFSGSRSAPFNGGLAGARPRAETAVLLPKHQA